MTWAKMINYHTWLYHWANAKTSNSLKFSTWEESEETKKNGLAQGEDIVLFELEGGGFCRLISKHNISVYETIQRTKEPTCIGPLGPQYKPVPKKVMHRVGYIFSSEQAEMFLRSVLTPSEMEFLELQMELLCTQ